jgi:hypothetical protein
MTGFVGKDGQGVAALARRDSRHAIQLDAMAAFAHPTGSYFLASTFLLSAFSGGHCFST